MPCTSGGVPRAQPQVRRPSAITPDLLHKFGLRIMRYGARSLATGAKAAGAPAVPVASITSWASITRLPVLFPLGSSGVNARKTGCTRRGCSPHEFSFYEGRWGRNRTGTLRLWSLLPFVQGRTRAPLKSPILAVQSVRKFTNVHRRWDQNWESKQPEIQLSTGCHLGCEFQELRQNLGRPIQS